MCKPKSVGGLGVQRLDQFNNACLAKLGSKIRTDNKNWWVRVVKQKYLQQEDFLTAKSKAKEFLKVEMFYSRD